MMSQVRTVSITTTDGYTYRAVCPTHRPILDVFADAGWILPSLCQRGQCGACTAILLTGQVRQGPLTVVPQSPEGTPVLLCSAFADDDCQIKLLHSNEWVTPTNQGFP